jgi:hypothetical protein
VRHLLAIFASEADLPVLGAAVDLARAHAARLAVAVPVREPPALIHLTSFVALDLEEGFEKEAESAFAKALARIPPDLPVTLRTVRWRTVGLILGPSGDPIDALLIRRRAGSDSGCARLCSRVVAGARKRQLPLLLV